MFNSTNNIVYWTIKERGFNVLPALRQMWVNEFKVCLKEAKWYNKGYKPTLEEYLSTSISSTGGPLMLFCSFFLTTHNLTQETVDYVANIPSLMKYSSLALRCNNDLGTSPVEMARGDNSKSIHCYMYENGVSEEVARECIENMVREYWKKMNKHYFEDRPFPGLQPFRNACLNLVRSSHCFYQYGDGMGKPNLESKDHVNHYVMSVLIEPIPIDECKR
ncbi:(+)-alpha-terpineol synthase-like [Syzygium oleosum]|uniref:(+)-alpha-terpineol synthase-like n=1 Tax=Syzygium oleosum TaxID=219896 RepID=UPI0024BA0DA0|nr:(+)-alpha-terpineol synthase-like [Syzygium oleosum]